jgi:hypothetical protein
VVFEGKKATLFQVRVSERNGQQRMVNHLRDVFKGVIHHMLRRAAAFHSPHTAGIFAFNFHSI